MSKTIQCGGFLGTLLGKLAALLMNIAVSFGKNALSPLPTMEKASAVDSDIQRKMCEFWGSRKNVKANYYSHF